MNEKTWSWSRTLWTVSGLILAITASEYYLPDFPHNWRVFPPFDLSGEMNLAVWWSGIVLLLGAGGLFYELAGTRKDGTAKAWMSLAAVFTVLSCDEIASLHERIETKLYLPLGMILLAMAAYAVKVLISRRETRGTITLVMIGVGVFVSVALQEKLEFMVPWPEWARGIRVAVEEGTELLGSYLILRGIVEQRRRDVPSRGLAAIIPRPRFFPQWPVLFAAGFFFNVLICFFLVPGLNDIGHKGNPAVWFPCSVYYILFAASFWRSREVAGPRKIVLNVMTLLFLLCSAGLMYNLSVFLPGITRLIPKEWLGGYAFFYSVQILLVVGAALCWRNIKGLLTDAPFAVGLALLVILSLMGFRWTGTVQKEFLLLSGMTLVAGCVHLRHLFSGSVYE